MALSTDPAQYRFSSAISPHVFETRQLWERAAKDAARFYLDSVDRTDELEGLLEALVRFEGEGARLFVFLSTRTCGDEVVVHYEDRLDRFSIGDYSR